MEAKKISEGLSKEPLSVIFVYRFYRAIMGSNSMGKIAYLSLSHQSNFLKNKYVMVIPPANFRKSMQVCKAQYKTN
jgi:hypothetical protein